MAQKVREGVFRTVFLIYFILLFYRENCSTVLPGYFTFSEKLKCYDTVTATVR